MNKIIITIAILLVAGGGLFMLRSQSVSTETSSPVASTTTSTTGSSTTTTSGGGQGIVAYQSGIKGTIMVGPTCPVEQDPPNPGCADKPLSTTVAIFRKSDPVHAYALFQSDAAGRFSASLPPGEYVVGAGESRLPSCPQTPVTVGPNQYVAITISCDSGIR